MMIGHYWSSTMFTKDVTVSTDSTNGIVAFFQDPKVYGAIVGAAILATIIIKLWNSIPKSILVFIFLAGLMVAGYLHF